ncbi:copper chaperone PCu(A)C [Rhizobium terrae]|uniref:copper chaperone PCu(A)C n=1 Tax=Rhizobium terrae TaxID=2171756 RepID=UPI003857E181
MKTITKIALSGLFIAAAVMPSIGTASMQETFRVAATDMNKTGAGDAASAHGVAVKVGDLEVSGAFTKAMLPGQPVGGGYFTVRNNGAADDRLVSASSPIAGTVELHEMAMQGQVMKMRRLDGGIAIPAGKTVELAPGGLHLMFMKVTEPFKNGGKVPVTLTFEKAGKVDITLPVGAAGPGGHQHN